MMAVATPHFFHASVVGRDLETTDSMFTPDAQWHFQPGMPQAALGLGLVWPARQPLRRIEVAEQAGGEARAWHPAPLAACPYRSVHLL